MASKNRVRATRAQSLFLPPLRAVTEMPDYPRACSRCGVLTVEADFGADRSKKSGHNSHCRACERADYASRARRDAVREAAWQTRLKELEEVHREKVAAAKREHEAGSVARSNSYARSECPIGARRRLAERDGLVSRNVVR